MSRIADQDLQNERMNRIAEQDLGGDAPKGSGDIGIGVEWHRVWEGSGLGIGFQPDPTETAALILPGYIGYVAANIHRIGFKPDPQTRSY